MKRCYQVALLAVLVMLGSCGNRKVADRWTATRANAWYAE